MRGEAAWPRLCCFCSSLAGPACDADLGLFEFEFVIPFCRHILLLQLLLYTLGIS